jgi:hypothetical protein
MTNTASVNIDFETITTEQALDHLVDLDKKKWGEAEAEASRHLHRNKSRGLLLNAIVHHSLNDYGDRLSAAARKSAKKQLSDDDRAALRKGG